MDHINLLKYKAKELMTTEHEFIDSITVELSNDPIYGWGPDQRLGKYDPLRKKITLYNEFSKFPSSPEIAVKNILPTYIHELLHAIQHRECGLILYLLALFFMRPKLEKDVQETEDALYEVK